MTTTHDQSTAAPMIPATGPRLVARFRNGEGRVMRWPVMAFDEDGHALIVDMRAGRLVRANSNPIFAGLELANARKPKPENTDKVSE